MKYHKALQRCSYVSPTKIISLWFKWSKNFPTYPWNIPQTLNCNQYFLCFGNCHVGLISGVCSRCMLFDVCWGSLRSVGVEWHLSSMWLIKPSDFTLNYGHLTRPMGPQQCSIWKGHPPYVREIYQHLPRGESEIFQGNLGWWNILIWPDQMLGWWQFPINFRLGFLDVFLKFCGWFLTKHIF